MRSILGLPPLPGAGNLPAEGEFPAAAIDQMREDGWLRACLPQAVGGLGLGSEAGRGPALLAVLHDLGHTSLSLGRLYEAHVNALRLVSQYGTLDQVAQMAGAVRQGALFALWVTDPPGANGLRLHHQGGLLHVAGDKQFCSGAGHVGHALVTAREEPGGETRLLMLTLDGSEEIRPLPAPLAGMRSATTGAVRFIGRSLPQDALIGGPGDYLREPLFSAGAWRAAAVALGGLHRLLEEMRGGLRARGRAAAPHQRLRFGEALIGYRASLSLLERVSALGEDLTAPAPQVLAEVALARRAVERACLDGLEAAQRSLGLAALLSGCPTEQLLRDLATYLRQPALDEALEKAAAFYLTDAVAPLGGAA